MLSFRLTRSWTAYVQNTVRAQSDLFTVQCCHPDSKADGTPLVNTVRAQSDLFTVQCCHWDSKTDGPPSQHCQSTGWSLHCSMLSFRIKGRWTPPGQHFQSTEWSLHCSMLSFRLKGRWTPQPNTVRAQSDLFTVNVVIQTQRQVDPPGQHCQSTELSLHCSMLSFRLKGRWTPSVQNTARAQSDLFTVQCCHSDSKADGPPLVNTVRAQSDLFTVQCCHSDSKADGPPSQTLSEHRVISSLFNVVIHSKADGPPKTVSEHRVISSLFNVVIQTQSRWTPSVQNTARVQSDLFTVQCCHSDSKADGPPQNTVRAESDLFTVQCCHSDSKADGPPLINTVRAQSDLFTVQCCHSESKAEGPPVQHCQSTEWSPHCSKHSKADGPPVKQSTEWSLHCSMLSFRLKGRWTPLVKTVRAQSDLFTVQCCHSDSKADGPPLQHYQSTEWSLHCSMLSFRLTHRWTPYVQKTARAQSDLFTVQCCHWDSQADGPPMCKTLPEYRVISSLFNVVIQTQRQMKPLVNIVRAQSDLFTVQCCHSDSKADGLPPKHCQSTEWSLHCSMLSFRLKGRWKPLQCCQSNELSVHCSMLSFRLKGRWTPFNIVRAQSDLFTVQCCHSDSKADGPPMVNIVRAQSYLFTVQCCNWDSKADGPPSQHCQSTEWFFHCSMLSFRLKGRWTPYVQNTARTQSYLFTVQCCHSESKAYRPPMC